MVHLPCVFRDPACTVDIPCLAPRGQRSTRAIVRRVFCVLYLSELVHTFEIVSHVAVLGDGFSFKHYRWSPLSVLACLLGVCRVDWRDG